MRLTAAIASLLLVLACRPWSDSHPAGGQGALRAKAGVVDSAIPREEALRRFRAGLPPVDSLTGGAPSRDELVLRFIRALEKSDTAALSRLVIDRREFAWIYYPHNPQGLPPYDLSPDLLWFMLDNRGRIGFTHLVRERMGAPLRYLRYRCDSLPSIEGENRVWGPCLVGRRQERGDVVLERLFGPIIERGGRFKFVNYANKLD